MSNKTVLTYEIFQRSEYGYDQTTIAVRELRERSCYEAMTTSERGALSEYRTFLLAGETHYLDQYGLGPIVPFELSYQHFEEDGYCQHRVRDIGCEDLWSITSTARFLGKVARRIAKGEGRTVRHSSEVHGWALNDPAKVVAALEQMGARRVHRPVNEYGSASFNFLYYRGEPHTFRTTNAQEGAA